MSRFRLVGKAAQLQDTDAEMAFLLPTPCRDQLILVIGFARQDSQQAFDQLRALRYRVEEIARNNGIQNCRIAT